MTPDELIRREAEAVIRAKTQSAQLSLEIERQITFLDGPLIYLLACARTEATDALLSMVDVEPTDVDAVRKLQNNVKRYIETAEWLSYAVTKGAEHFENIEDPNVVADWQKLFAARAD